MIVLSINASGIDTPCTGALVADNLIVTARHCVANTVPGAFECDAMGELVSPGEAGQMGLDVAPEMISLLTQTSNTVAEAKGKQVFSTGSPSYCRDDLAFVVLDRSLHYPIRPIRVFDPITVGEHLTIVGYGAGGSAVGRQRVDGLPVLSVGPDQPTVSDTSATPPRSFAAGRSVCAGDSGAPAISEGSGAILGVASLESGKCESPDVRNFFAQIRAHPLLVADAFAAAGHEPWYEGSSPEGECPDCEQGGGCSLASLPRHATRAPVALLFLLVFARRGARRRPTVS